MKNIPVPYNYTPRHYQLALWDYMRSNRKHKRAVVIRHRRAGKDVDAINICFEQAMQKVGIYAHIFPTSIQGRSVIWNGLTNDGRRFRDYFPDEAVEKINENEMRLTMVNGSQYRVFGSDNPDSLRGLNITGAVLSEYQDHDPQVWQRIVEPMLLANGGWMLAAYTPKGRNHGYKLLERAKRENWFWESLDISKTSDDQGNPIIDPEYIEKLRKDGIDEAVINSEYFCSFESSVVGAYYDKQIAALRANGRVRDVPVEPALLTHTAWDLGFGDCTAIWFIQQYGEVDYRAIDYFESSNEPLSYYVRVLQEKQAKYGLTYGNHYFPHDVSVHDLSTGKRRVDTLRDMGLRATVVTKHGLDDGIDRVRSMLPLFWFDEKRTERGLLALAEYRREFDGKLQTFRQNPEHSWSSHGADSFRMFAMGHRRASRFDRSKLQKVADSEYDDI